MFCMKKITNTGAVTKGPLDSCLLFPDPHTAPPPASRPVPPSVNCSPALKPQSAGSGAQLNAGFPSDDPSFLLGPHTSVSKQSSDLLPPALSCPPTAHRPSPLTCQISGLALVCAASIIHHHYDLHQVFL
jgi:hypothetical protein